MGARPSAMLVTMPAVSMVATAVLPLLHVPPGKSDNVVVAPRHMDNVPMMSGGPGITVTFFISVLTHPMASVTCRATCCVPATVKAWVGVTDVLVMPGPNVHTLEVMVE